MKRKLYRIDLKVVESGRTLITQRVIEVPIPEYLPKLRKDFPDAVSIYVALVQEWEEEDASQTAVESIIILGYENAD